MSGFARSTLLITGFSGLGLALSFLVNLVIASRFGAGGDMDVYFAATTLPTLLSAILTGSLASTFLPVFAEYRGKDPREAWRIVSSFLNLAVLASAVLCVAAIAAAAPLTRAMTPGFTAAQVAESAALLRWLLPSVVFTVINELISSIYFSNRKFLAPMIIKVVGPALTIGFVLAFSSSLSLASVVFATLTAGCVQTGILVGGLIRERSFHYSPALDFGHPGVRRVLALMGPLVLGMSFYRLLPGFERWLASGFGTGAISHLGYATRLTNVIQPLLISGISISGFALMSEMVAKRDYEGFRATMEKSLAMLAFLSIPCAVLLGGFARPVIGILFERGAFTARDTAATGLVFALYLLSIPASTLGTVVSQGFYAYQDTRTPAYLGIGEIALYVALCLLLAERLGLAAMPVSYGIYFYLSVFMLSILLARKTGFSVLGLAARPLACGLAASLAALALGLGVSAVLPGPRLGPAAGLTAAAAAYFLIQAMVFRRPEAGLLLRVVLERLPRPGRRP